MPAQGILFAFQILALLYSVILHEIAHGAVALSLGDDTAKRMGRLTLNPFKHLDWFGSIILPILTSQLGFMFGYAKPVPYVPENLRDRVYGPVKVALAGPTTNLVLAIIVGTAMRVFHPVLGPVAFQLLGYIVWLNILLGVFNIMPIPPLDGHWLLMTFLPVRFAGFRIFLYRYGLVLLAVFIIFIFPLLIPVVSLLFSLFSGQPMSVLF